MSQILVTRPGNGALAPRFAGSRGWVINADTIGPYAGGASQLASTAKIVRGPGGRLGIRDTAASAGAINTRIGPAGYVPITTIGAFWIDATNVVTSICASLSGYEVGDTFSHIAIYTPTTSWFGATSDGLCLFYTGPWWIKGVQHTSAIEAGKIYGFAGALDWNGDNGVLFVNGVNSTRPLLYDGNNVTRQPTAGGGSVASTGWGSSQYGGVCLAAQLPVRLSDSDLRELSLDPWKLLARDVGRGVRAPLFFGSAAERRRNRLALAMM